MQHLRNICSICEQYEALAKNMEQSGDDDGDGDDGRIFPEHPSPILHAPRDNISRKGNPSLRCIYIGVRDCPYGICCPWVRGGWDLDALEKNSAAVAVTWLFYNFRQCCIFVANAAYFSPMLHMFRQCCIFFANAAYFSPMLE